MLVFSKMNVHHQCVDSKDHSVRPFRAAIREIYRKPHPPAVHLHLHLALHTLIHDDTMITFGIRR